MTQARAAAEVSANPQDDFSYVGGEQGIRAAIYSGRVGTRIQSARHLGRTRARRAGRGLRVFHQDGAGTLVAKARNARRERETYIWKQASWPMSLWSRPGRAIPKGISCTEDGTQFQSEHGYRRGHNVAEVEEFGRAGALHPDAIHTPAYSPSHHQCSPYHKKMKSARRKRMEAPMAVVREDMARARRDLRMVSM